MKKFLRTLLFGMILALAMSSAVFAAETDLLIAPDPNAVPERQGDFYVMVNGEYVTFPDAVPQGRDNRSYLPMAATFSLLGFPEELMTWTPEGVITATKPDVTYTPFNGGQPRQGDVTVTMTVGSDRFSIHYEGDMTVGPHGDLVHVYYDHTCDAAPYVDSSTWRTYVPFGLVADALGYKVGWDGVTGAVIIDDVDAILAENTETYALMDKYMAYSKSVSGEKVRMNGTAVASLYSCDWTAEAMNETSLYMEGTYDSYTAAPAAMQMELELATQLTAYVNGEESTQALIDAGELPALPASIDFDLRGDMAAGTLYFKSAALSALMEQPDMADAWYKMDYNAMLEGSGMTWTELMSSVTAYSDELTSMTGEELMRYLLEVSPILSVGLTTRDYLELYNAMLGDSAFVKQDDAYVNDMSALGTPMTFVLYTNSSGSKVTGYGIELYMLDPTMGQVNYIIAQDGSELAVYMGMDTTYAADLFVEEGSYLVFELALDGKIQSTAKSPAVEPPADAVIVDLMERMEEELAAQAQTLPAS